MMRNMVGNIYVSKNEMEKMIKIYNKLIEMMINMEDKQRPIAENIKAENMVTKDEMEKLINIYDELTMKFKQENEKLKKELHELRRDRKKQHKELKEMLKVQGTRNKDKRSYSEVMKRNKKKNVILVKPKVQQNSEETKKIIKEKVDIKNMTMGIFKFKKSNNGHLELRCRQGFQNTTGVS